MNWKQNSRSDHGPYSTTNYFCFNLQGIKTMEYKRKALTVWESPTVNEPHPFALFILISVLQEISFFLYSILEGKTS